MRGQNYPNVIKIRNAHVHNVQMYHFMNIKGRLLTSKQKHAIICTRRCRDD